MAIAKPVLDARPEIRQVSIACSHEFFTGSLVAAGQPPAGGVCCPARLVRRNARPTRSRSHAPGKRCRPARCVPPSRASTFARSPPAKPLSSRPPASSTRQPCPSSSSRSPMRSRSGARSRSTCAGPRSSTPRLCGRSRSRTAPAAGGGSPCGSGPGPSACSRCSKSPAFTTCCLSSSPKSPVPPNGLLLHPRRAGAWIAPAPEDSLPQPQAVHAARRHQHSPQADATGARSEACGGPSPRQPRRTARPRSRACRRACAPARPPGARRR